MIAKNIREIICGCSSYSAYLVSTYRRNGNVWIINFFLKWTRILLPDEYRTAAIPGSCRPFLYALAAIGRILDVMYRVHCTRSSKNQFLIVLVKRHLPLMRLLILQCPTLDMEANAFTLHTHNNQALRKATNKKQFELNSAREGERASALTYPQVHTVSKSNVKR